MVNSNILFIEVKKKLTENALHSFFIFNSITVFYNLKFSLYFFQATFNLLILVIFNYLPLAFSNKKTLYTIKHTKKNVSRLITVFYLLYNFQKYFKNNKTKLYIKKVP